MPDSRNHEDLEKALNEINGRIIKVEQNGDYTWEVIYEEK